MKWLKNLLKLRNDDVEWVVNEHAELGVKIGNEFFFLYKGHSYKGGTKWRYVYKREFGECCHPLGMTRMHMNGSLFHGSTGYDL